MSASGIRKVFELSNSMKDPINLSIGQVDFPIDDKVKMEAISRIENDFNSYTQSIGILPLREAILNKLKIKNQILNAKLENIMISSAVSGALSLIIPVLIDSGDEIIIFDPYFVAYKQIILLFGGKASIVKKNLDFSINFENLENAINSKTKAIIINSPENPSGYVSNYDELVKLASIAKKYDLYVISDEIYEDFVYDVEHYSIAKIYEKTILLNGFSKSYAMASWRLAYVFAPEEIINQMLKLQQFTFVCAPLPFQYAAIKALDTDISNHIKNYKKKRDIIYDALKNDYEIIKTQGAFYFFIKYPYAKEIFLEDCIKNNLLIVPGDSFSEDDTHFRLSFANSDDNLKKACEILLNLKRT